jgi:hypothetical protein
MKISVVWKDPVELQDGAKQQMIYACPDLEALPYDPGVYVFGRRHGDNLAPLYIGQAENIRSRIRQQLNNLKLMKGVESAENGRRILMFGVLSSRRGQSLPKILDILETSLIQAALANGYELLNKQGTKRPTHMISSSGSRWHHDVIGRNVRVRQG